MKSYKKILNLPDGQLSNCKENYSTFPYNHSANYTKNIPLSPILTKFIYINELPKHKSLINKVPKHNLLSVEVRETK